MVKVPRKNSEDVAFEPLDPVQRRQQIYDLQDLWLKEV
jgi:hypothetical protein